MIAVEPHHLTTLSIGHCVHATKNKVGRVTLRSVGILGTVRNRSTSVPVLAHIASGSVQRRGDRIDRQVLAIAVEQRCLADLPVSERAGWRCSRGSQPLPRSWLSDKH